jgi:hypothetical protein
LTDIKKERERHQFERFGISFAGLPPGPWLQPDPPEADIVIECADGLVAIELTELVPGGQFKRDVEGAQALIAAEARRLYEGEGHPPVHVWVSWAPDLPPKRLRRLAARLSRVVAARTPLGDEIIEVVTSAALDWPITRVAIARSSGYDASDWRDGDMHEVVATTAEDIRRRISDEDDKVRRYRTSYASRWLVLINEAEGPSTWGFVIDGVRQAHYGSPYDRVFLFHMHRGRCDELRLTVSVSEPEVQQPAGRQRATLREADD